MIPGGVTEAISYFAGYLRLFEDIARDRDQLDGGPPPAPDQDYTLKHPVQDVRPDSDDFQIIGTPNPDPGPDDFRILRLPLAHLPKLVADHIVDNPIKPASSALPPFLIGGGDGGGGGGGGSSVTMITVTYQPGGAQSEVEIHQFNHMVNNNQLIGTQDVGLANQLALQSEHMLVPMMQQVDDVVPARWNAPQDNMPIISWTQSHDQKWLDNHGVHDPLSVQPGYYLNGTLQQLPPDALNQDLSAPLNNQLVPNKVTPDTGHGLGQWADIGDNHATNAAQIIDAGSAAGTMIVLGNYYMTNAIFQTNSYANNDHIDAGSGQGAINILPNHETNAAGFIQHAGLFSSLQTTYAGPHWNVDVVNGNYYDVHTMVQTNYLSNNNVVFEESSATHYNVVAGGNQLTNFAQVLDGNVHYDLIIVGGSYHGMNVIYQNNLLLNNDTIWSGGGGSWSNGYGAGPLQSIEAGGNQLTNAATIDTFGDQNFSATNNNTQTVVNDIANGDTQLDPSVGNLINGYGGTLNVLYVTGDFYDVNAIWQTNLMANSNYLVQMLMSPYAAALNALYPDGAAAMQSVMSGNNQLLNDASIVFAGADQTFVGGGAYTDSVLLQTNLLPHEPFASPSPQSLASELVAFLNDSSATSDTSPTPVPVTTTVTVNDDPISSMMH